MTFDEVGQLCVVSTVYQHRISRRVDGEPYCAVFAEARRSVFLVILPRALPVGPLLGKHGDDLSTEQEFWWRRLKVVSRSSEIQLEVGGKAGNLTLG